MQKKTNQLSRVIVTCISEMKGALTRGGILGNTESRNGVPISRSPMPVTYLATIDDLGVIRHHTNQACHAGLSSPTTGKAPIKYCVSRLQWENSGAKDLHTKKEKEDFFEWLTVESPFAPAFLYGGGARTVRRGFVICTSEVPSNLLAGALIATRGATEFRGNVMKNWNSLVSRGLNKNLAFFIAHWYDDGSSGVVCKTYRNSHVSIEGSTFDKKHILNFCNKVMVYPNKLFTQQHRYSPVHKLWGDTEGYDTDLRDIDRSSFVNALKATKEAERVKKGVGAINPFKAPAKDPNYIDSDIFHDILVGEMKKFFGELAHD